MKYLAFDLGTHGAWAGFNGGRIESGPIDLSCYDARPAKLVIFKDALLELMGADTLAVAYEAVVGRSRDLQRLFFGQTALIEMRCAALEIPQPLQVYPPTLKLYATGDGRAPKCAMLAAAANWIHEQNGVGGHGFNYDEADAILVLKWLGDALANQEAV